MEATDYRLINSMGFSSDSNSSGYMPDTNYGNSDWATTNQQGSYDYPQDDWATVNQQGSYDYPSEPQKIFIAGSSTPSLSGWSSLGDTKNTPTKPLWDSSSSSGSRTTSTGGSALPQISTTTRTPTQPMPTLKKVAPFKMPPRDEEKIKKFTQEAAALGIGEVRSQALNTINKLGFSGNPTVDSQNAKSVITGTGEAIAKIMAGASKEAWAKYQQLYSDLLTEITTIYNYNTNYEQNKYNAEMQAYLASMNTTNTTGASSGGVTGTRNTNASYGAPSGG